MDTIYIQCCKYRIVLLNCKSNRLFLICCSYYPGEKNEKISIWLLSIVVLLCVTSCKENNEPEMKKIITQKKQKIFS